MQHNQQTQPFYALFESLGRTYRIPEYQRAYSWGKIQIDQFIQDLRDAQETYYLGHYLFERLENGKTNELLVVDGQQRLTTCVLFFSALCRQLTTHPLEETVAAEVRQWEKLFLRSEVSSYQPKLTTVSYDDHYFQNILEAKASELARPSNTLATGSQRLLCEAYLAFDKVTKEATDTQLLAWGRLVADASVTQLVVPSKREAAQLFAFQNDRGKSLTVLETIKSYLMLQVLLFGVGPENPDRVLPELEGYFARIYKQVTQISLSEDEVLSYYWRSTRADPYNGAPVAESIKKALSKLPKEQRVAWVRTFVEQLASAFEYVKEIEQDDYEFARDLRTLNNMALAYPLLLRAYRDGISKNTKERLFRFLENITFRYKLRGGRAIIQDRFKDCFFNGKPVLSDAELNTRIDTFINRLRENWSWYSYWNDSEIRNVLHSSFYRNPVDNYLLWKYERRIAAIGNPYKMPYEQVLSQESIEHIAPQNPREATANNPDWKRDYGNYHDEVQPSEGIESGNWLNKLGNLMLLAQRQNSQASNRPFAVKLALYNGTSQLMQQRQLEDFLPTDPENPGNKVRVWDKAAIERRHKHIVAAAQDIWDLAKI